MVKRNLQHLYNDKWNMFKDNTFFLYIFDDKLRFKDNISRKRVTKTLQLEDTIVGIVSTVLSTNKK
jgi:hypothetical protein